MIPLSYKRVASTVSLDLPDMHAHADRDSSAKIMFRRGDALFRDRKVCLEISLDKQCSVV